MCPNIFEPVLKNYCSFEFQLILLDLRMKKKTGFVTVKNWCQLYILLKEFVSRFVIMSIPS